MHDGILTKRKDGSWAVLQDGKWVPVAPPSQPQSSISKSDTVADPIDRIVKRVTSRVSLPELGEQLDRRLANVLRLFLKNVRNEVNTRSILVRPVNVGGLAFSRAVVDQLMVEAKEELRKTIAQQEDSSVTVSLSAPDKSSINPSRAKTLADANTIAAQTEQIEIARKEDKEQNPSMERSVISDVRIPRPAVVGPQDEIRMLTLKEFRNLNRQPAAAASIIFDKIKLFEDESYEQLVLALQAWRESQLFRNYLAIIQRSLEEGKSVAIVLDEQKTINPAEFRAIAALNERLRHWK